MEIVDSATFVAGFGIEGDRHAVRSGARTARQVLLVDEQTLQGFGLVHGQVRENVTVADVDLHGLEAGQRLALGDQVVLEITGHCAPCARMDEIRPGLRRELNGQRGMLATVVNGGLARVGDVVQAVERSQVV
jgi:MOSC domain-containing protein YiiM